MLDQGQVVFQGPPREATQCLNRYGIETPSSWGGGGYGHGHGTPYGGMFPYTGMMHDSNGHGLLDTGMLMPPSTNGHGMMLPDAGMPYAEMMLPHTSLMPDPNACGMLPDAGMSYGGLLPYTSVMPDSTLLTTGMQPYTNTPALCMFAPVPNAMMMFEEAPVIYEANPFLDAVNPTYIPEAPVMYEANPVMYAADSPMMLLPTPPPSVLPPSYIYDDGSVYGNGNGGSYNMKAAGWIPSAPNGANGAEAAVPEYANSFFGDLMLCMRRQARLEFTNYGAIAGRILLNLLTGMLCRRL